MHIVDTVYSPLMKPVRYLPCFIYHMDDIISVAYLAVSKVHRRSSIIVLRNILTTLSVLNIDALLRNSIENSELCYNDAK